MTSGSQQREQGGTEQGGTWQQVPPVAEVPKARNQDFIQVTPSTQKLPVNQRAGKDHSHRQQEYASFQVNMFKFTIFFIL